MKAYRTYSTITGSRQVILSEVPFRAGETVEIVVLAKERAVSDERVNKLKSLFKETQALPQIKTLSEEDILREIRAHRDGK